VRSSNMYPQIRAATTPGTMKGKRIAPRAMLRPGSLALSTRAMPKPMTVCRMMFAKV